MSRPPITRTPSEVFEAVTGDPTALVQLLRSGDPISQESREALALWIEGKLPPARPPHRPKAVRAWGDIPNGVWLQFSAEKYHRIAKWLRKRGRMHNSAENLIEAIARQNNLDVNALRNAVRNGPPEIPEPATDLAELYQAWVKNVRRK